jgi:hypothetical protein
MSYKDKAVGEYRGGAIETTKPTPRRYPCFAGGCPMPGTIFTGGTDQPGTCAWHYGVLSADIPKVTKALQDWGCVSYEIREARRALTGEVATDPAALQQAFDTAWERLRASIDEGWVDQLKPGTITTRNRFTREAYDTKQPEGYGDWAKRLERFLGARVVEVLSIRQRAAA